MAFLGDLIVKMGADIKPLQSGLTKAGSGIKGFTSSIASMMSPITAGFAAVAAGAATASAAVYVFTGRIAGLAKIADKAAQTGLSGSFLQRLGYAADQSGVDVNVLEKSVGKLTIMVGRASSGATSAVAAFDKIGLSVATLKAMSPQQQFESVAAAIAKLPTAADRASAAVEIFGKSGLEMTGLLSGGVTGLNALMEDAAALGIGVSEEGLARAAAADDAIQRMYASFGALMDQMAVGLAPTFEAVSKYITDWIPPITEFIGKFNGLNDKVKFIGDLFESGMDLAIATIAVKWDEMLDDMLKSAETAGKRIAKGLASGNLGQITAGIAGGPLGNRSGKARLRGAQKKFDSVLSQVTNSSAPSTIAPLNEAPAEQPKIKDDGSKLKTLFGGFAESAAGMFEQAKLAGQSKLTDLGIKGNYLGSIVKSMFTNDKARIDAPERSTAANKGSREALMIAMRGSKNTYETKSLKMQEKVIEIAQKQLMAIKDAAPQLVAEF